MAHQQLPTPTDVLAANLTKYRNKRGWTQQQFADVLESHGLPWDRTTVAKVEGRSRQVTVDEAVAIAFALGIPLVALLCPTEQITVNLTPHFDEKTAFDTWGWMTGDSAPLGITNEDVRFYIEARQDTEVAGERRVPGLQRLRFWVRRALSTAGSPGLSDAWVLSELIPVLDDISESAQEIASRLRREQAAAQRKSAKTPQRKAKTRGKH